MNTPTAVSGQGEVQSIQVNSTTIRIAFTTQLDASTVHRGTVILTRSDGTAIDEYNVSIAPMNPRAILIHLPPKLADGMLYRLSLNSDEAISILDLSGQPVEAFRMEFR